jgi:hypothetical protein
MVHEETAEKQTKMTSDKKGKTLWEMFMERLEGGNGAGIAFANPLELGVGAPVQIAHANGPEFAQYAFSVQEIREYTRRIGASEFRFTDYVLRGVNTNSFAAGDALIVRLRAVPNEAGGHDTLLLRLYDEFPFAEDFLGVVNDNSGLFEVTDNESQTAHTFHRINELRVPYEAAVLVISATTPNGKAASGKTSGLKFEYWDYWRELNPNAKEFVFVEQNLETGWFQIWRGQEFFS